MAKQSTASASAGFSLCLAGVRRSKSPCLQRVQVLASWDGFGDWRAGF